MTVTDRNRDGADVLDAALLEAVRQTGASVGGIYLLSDSDQVLHLAVVYGIPLDLLASWNQVALAAPLPVADAVRDDRLVWVGTQEELVRCYPRAAVALPYRFALAATPLSGSDRCWGALMLVWPSSHPPRLTDRQRGHITSSGRRVARLLERAASSRDTRLPESFPEPRLVTLPPAGRPRTGRTAEDFAERLPGGCVSLDLDGRITFLTSGAVELLGLSADRLIGTLPWQSLPWLDDPVYEDHYRSAVISRESRSYLARRPPDRWLRFELHPDASGISVRITHAPTTAAQPTGQSEAAPPTDAARGGAGRLYQLMHLAAALTEAAGVADVVDLIADQIMPAFGAQGLMLTTVDGGRLRVIGSRGYPPAVVERLDGLPVDADLTPAGDVLAANMPQFFESAEDLAAAYPRAPALSGKQAWAFLPLNVAGQPDGCCVLSYARPRSFTADERAVLTSLGGLIAQALDRARLYDAKKDVAHGLQQALLPHRLPSVHGLDIGACYLPASYGMDIGGDFYDIICLDPTTCSAVIGDVQGHNVAAAALMGQVRTAVHAHSSAATSPGEVLVRTNRLLADLHADLLVSCLCVHFDITHCRADIASAGHPPPLLRHSDGRTDVLSVEPGPLLGVASDAAYPVTRVGFPPGALLALYTDGLVEQPGHDMAESMNVMACCLSEARDEDLDDLPGLMDTLVRTTRPGGSHADDIAILLLRAQTRNGSAAT
ncbi:SpoIIE family protein phosphatase [Actinacidiphila paucisporea]|uniref:GAF domain-containing protein n=1 Tax=Actinacidiphila paucisporea TaxID=310782 RepID=A0A1M7QA02_9ACTN|nr:SpoIIE family protein phosphatase [Actinacidiphila paucisporea]SHN27412.1 GAF domain-containing protein [Actinacidiphila paucisporea]